MEILNKTADKRTVLAAFKDDEQTEGICRDIARCFNVVRCTSTSEALAVMNRQFNSLSAVVIDVNLASADNFTFLRNVTQERCFDTIPIVVAAASPADSACIHCLDEGAVDIIELPCDFAISERRINNAIQLKRSATFYEIESMLRRLPSMVFLKDAEGRYVFSTQYWHHLDTGGDPKWTIRGKTDVDIRKDRENALLAMKADEEIIRTGKGTSYVIEINTDGVQDFIQLIKEPVFDDHGNVTGIIALGNDVTESEQMKRKLAHYARVDELTGLGNRRAFNEFVSDMPSRTDFPIAVISADCDSLKMVNDTFGHLVGDEYIHMAAAVLRAGVPDGNLVFRVGGDEFAAFAPNTNAEQAASLVDAMRRKAEYFKLNHGETIVSYGIAIIDSPDADAQAAIDLADQRMYAEKASHKHRE